MSGVPRMSAFSFSCACSRNVTAIVAGVGRERAVQLLMTGRDERVELRGAASAVGQVEVEDHVADHADVEPAPRHAVRLRAGRNAE